MGQLAPLARPLPRIIRMRSPVPETPRALAIDGRAVCRFLFSFWLCLLYDVGRQETMPKFDSSCCCVWGISAQKRGPELCTYKINNKGKLIMCKISLSRKK